MLTGDGMVKILDFGLAKLAGAEGITQTGTTLGTVAYMSPEQLRGQEVDQRADIWSLGVVLFELVAGERPSRASSFRPCLWGSCRASLLRSLDRGPACRWS